jgi:hypothetical protein
VVVKHVQGTACMIGEMEDQVAALSERVRNDGEKWRFWYSAVGGCGRD